MGRKRIRGINEIKIKLLPEKAKRDYLLRLVVFIIVLIFVIINFLLIYLPYMNLNAELNNLKSENAEKFHQEEELRYKLDFFYHDIFHNNDGAVIDLLNSKVDFNQVMLIFDEDATYVDVHDHLSYNDLSKPENNVKIKPLHSFIESLQFSEENYAFTVVIQFDNFDDLTAYQNQVERIKYVSFVEVGNYTIVDDRVKTTIQITIEPDNEYCPKVGDVE